MQQNVAARERLVQAARLQTVGRLAAGLAHEINTPAQYVSDNLHFLARALESLQKVLAPLSTWAAGDGPLELEAQQQLREAWRKQRIESLLREGLPAVAQGKSGIERIAALIEQLQAFGGSAGSDERTISNVNEAITRALAATRGDRQGVSRVDLELDPQLPAISCQLAELGQVFLHLLYNSTEAFRGAFGGEPRGSAVHIRSRAVDGGVEVTFSDDGPGIAPEIRDRVFDPFFTTKQVGSGMGQGLAVAYDVVVNRHGGRLSVEPSEGTGARFRIWLPLRPPEPAGAQG
jgi:signal transduction histidine kinase